MILCLLLSFFFSGDSEGVEPRKRCDANHRVGAFARIFHTEKTKRWKRTWRHFGRGGDFLDESTERLKRIDVAELLPRNAVHEDVFVGGQNWSTRSQLVWRSDVEADVEVRVESW